MVRDVPRLARSEMALATSVGPSKAAIVFDVVMPCPLGFASSVGRVLLASTRACACPEDGDQERRNQDALRACPSLLAPRHEARSPAARSMPSCGPLFA